MSNYILCKNPKTQLNLMIDEQFEPQLVSYIQRMGCRYAKETRTKPINGRVYSVLKDIQGPNGAAVGELIGLFYSLEWGSLMEGTDRKFYIMISQRKEKKKHAQKNRKADCAGSESGNSGKSSGNSGRGEGPVDGPAGDGLDGWPDDDDILWEPPRID